MKLLALNCFLHRKSQPCITSLPDSCLHTASNPEEEASMVTAERKRCNRKLFPHRFTRCSLSQDHQYHNPSQLITVTIHPTSKLSSAGSKTCLKPNVTSVARYMAKHKKPIEISSHRQPETNRSKHHSAYKPTMKCKLSRPVFNLSRSSLR